ncbi:MAG: hypothetical protein KC897_04165 [Candidatus Omnitrophica bacterium]|nr:hypothetical protein [Candidatus Omnitrophota bacterium]MCB9721881.1 hypothetical protein [Candidatus Omnitrophota bacterium]
MKNRLLLLGLVFVCTNGFMVLPAAAQSDAENMEDGVELITDASELFKSGTMKAIQVFQATILSYKPGGLIEVRMLTGPLKETTVKCTITKETQGIEYGYKNEDDFFMGAISGNFNLNQKAQTDEKLGKSIGKKIKIGLNGDTCTYVSLLEEDSASDKEN